MLTIHTTFEIQKTLPVQHFWASGRHHQSDPRAPPNAAADGHTSLFVLSCCGAACVLPAGLGCGVMLTPPWPMRPGCSHTCSARQLPAPARAPARARHASSPPSVAGHGCARRDAAAKAAAVARDSRAGVSVAISSSRLRSCGRGFGGRAGTHRSEHVQYELRARSLVQTCASKAERVRGSVRDTVHEEAMLASSTVDERRSSSKTKVALPLSEIVWRSTPATAQIHAHLGDFGSVGYDLGLLGLRRTQIVALPTARSAALAKFCRRGRRPRAFPRGYCS